MCIVPIRMVVRVLYNSDAGSGDFGSSPLSRRKPSLRSKHWLGSNPALSQLLFFGAGVYAHRDVCVITHMATRTNIVLRAVTARSLLFPQRHDVRRSSNRCSTLR